MAFTFYNVVNGAASHMMTHQLEKNLVHRVYVYESLQFLSATWISISLTIVFVINAMANTVFTSFVAYE